MSGPTRQRSLRERLHGIGISWQGKKSKSYHSKDGQKFPETESKKSGSLDSRSFDPIPSCDEDANLVQSSDKEPSKEAKKGPSPSPPPDVATKTASGTSEKANAKSVDFKESSMQPEKKMLSRSFTQPQGTQEYKVQASDTLPGIAARFQTTPSELAKLNRLTARVVFPGQLLFVPERKAESCTGDRKKEDKEKSDSSKLHEGDGNEKTSNGNDNFPSGHGVEEESLVPVRKTSVTDPLRIPYRRFSERLQRFLKVKARHFTDGQGVVSGVLIITPNAVMFDPNVSDPLVIEHGTESYGVIAPLEMVMRTAIYYDIAHMKVKHAPETQLNIPKPDIYYGKLASKTTENSVSEMIFTTESKDAPGDGRSGTENELTSKPDIKCVTTKALGTDATGTKPELTKEKALAAVDSDKQTDRPKAENVTKSSDQSSAEKAAEKSVVEEKRETKTVLPDKAQGTSVGPKTSRSLEEKSEPADKILSDSKDSSSTSEPTPANSAAETSLPKMDAEKPIESRRERMLKRLSYPMESITSYTQSSISRILSSSPKSLVDFSSGLFVRNSEEEKLKDQDQPSGADKRTAEVEEVEEENLEEPAAPEKVPVVSGKDAEPPTEPSNEEAKESSASTVPQTTEQTSENVTIGYKNLVEEKPEIFAVLDKLLGQKTAQDDEGPPLYLCLRMGHPKERKVLMSTPILSYGKKRVRSEYWFSIPQHRVDDLYNFIQQWIPNLYGDIDEVDPDSIGFTPIDDTEDEEEEEKDEESAAEKDGESQEEEEGATKTNPRSFLRLVEDHFGFRSISPTDWEVLSMIETDKCPSADFELPLPELMAPSEIFKESHVKELYTLLPARAVGYPWSLLFSTSTHGFNLKTLYRNVAHYDAPIMLAVADTERAVFGAMLPTNLRESNHFYGTGESFLFTFHPEFKVYNWSGVNNYFIKGDAESIAIGAGDGQFGLWIDGDLYRGSSKKCQTYDNATLSASEDFVIKALEVWGFM